jgi:hypothetical protein
MDYTKIYNQIIERAQNRKLDGYIEKHHIIPKCMGGLDEKENIVELTAREHFICHRLLCEIYPNQIKLWYALFLMSINKFKKSHQRYKVSSKEYERIKIEWNKHVKGRKKPVGFGEKLSKILKGKIRSEESRRNISLATRNKPKHTFESKEKIKQYMTGKKYSQESKDKMSQSSKGKIKNWDERNRKASEKLKGRKIEWNLKGIPKKPHTRSTNIPVTQYDLQGNFIKEYTTIMEASNGNKSLHEGIRMCLKGKYKTAGGFIWKTVETKNL